MAKVQDPERRRVAVNVSLDLGLLSRLDAAAEREGTTRSALLRRLLAQALEDEETEDALLAAAAEEAHDDPDNQEHVPWEQVKADRRHGG
jgi:predicted DNA-binding protein